jgi:hypothetical protein
MEERRSIHSLHSLRTSRSHPGPRPLYEISYIDEEGSMGKGSPVPRDSPESGKQSSASVNRPVTLSKNNLGDTNNRGTVSVMSSHGRDDKERLLTKDSSHQMERSRSAPFNNITPGSGNASWWLQFLLFLVSTSSSQYHSWDYFWNVVLFPFTFFSMSWMNANVFWMRYSISGTKPMSSSVTLLLPQLNPSASSYPSICQSMFIPLPTRDSNHIRISWRDDVSSLLFSALFSDKIGSWMQFTI